MGSSSSKQDERAAGPAGQPESVVVGPSSAEEVVPLEDLQARLRAVSKLVDAPGELVVLLVNNPEIVGLVQPLMSLSAIDDRELLQVPAGEVRRMIAPSNLPYSLTFSSPDSRRTISHSFGVHAAVGIRFMARVDVVQRELTELKRQLDAHPQGWCSRATQLAAERDAIEEAEKDRLADKRRMPIASRQEERAVETGVDPSDMSYWSPLLYEVLVTNQVDLDEWEKADQARAKLDLGGLMALAEIRNQTSNRQQVPAWRAAGAVGRQETTGDRILPGDLVDVTLTRDDRVAAPAACWP